MEKYEEATWNDLAVYGEVSPVAGLDAVTSKQLAELLGVPMEVLSKHKSRYEKELRLLGMFTAAPKKLADRLHVLERTAGNGFAVELEGGGRLEMYCGNTVYFPAPAACRLADVVSGVNDEKKESGCRGRKPSKEPAKKSVPVLALPEVQRAAVEHERVEGLVPVTIRDDQPSVSARDLHEFLEVGADYRHWFPRMCEYGFTEGLDFNPVKIDRVQQEGGRMVVRTVDDAILSIDMAKEICMLQRNEKGKLARRYFIQLEKDWNSPEKVLARALLLANKRAAALEARNDELDVENKALAREQLTWDYRSILVRLVRMYGAKVFDDFKKGWRAFFRELRYKEGICLNNRAGDGPFIDRLVGDEWVKAVAVAASMCKEQYISMSWAVNEVNLDLVNRN